VVLAGIVQARCMESPIRPADRFTTGVGRLRLGGAGAAGAPQPTMVPTIVHAMPSGRAKTRSLPFMLFKRKSFFSWRQNRPQGGVKLRIFEVEARSVQASRHYALTLQYRGLRHFAKSQS
jgi:hypothetical protein